MQLEFGPGDRPRKLDYIGVDIRPGPTVKYLCAAWEISAHVAANSVTDIYSRHFLEHLTWQQADQTLRVWYDILGPGGRLEIIVPNIAYHIQQWIEARRPPVNDKKQNIFRQAVEGLWGQQTGGELWDIHKSGYDWPLLQQRLEEIGFVKINRLPGQNAKHLHVESWK